jgi:hypothetical protein
MHSIIKFVVSALTSKGRSAFCPIQIRCTAEEFVGGGAQLAAENYTLGRGYSCVGLSYNDIDGPGWLFTHFGWDGVAVINSLPAATFALCKHCDHFLLEGEPGHCCDEEHHDPDEDHAAEPRGEYKSLPQWKKERPDLFVHHADDRIGPNSRHHVTQLDVKPSWETDTERTT